MARSTTAFAQKTFSMSRKKFDTISASKRLMDSMAAAIDNMIDEIRKPVDPEVSGSARKAELQSIKQTATMAKSKKTKTTQEDLQKDSQGEYWWSNITITDKDVERYKFWESMWNEEYED